MEVSLMIVGKNARRMLFVILTAALFLASCNVGATPAPTQDINALSTAIVLTTVAQLSSGLTQTAQAQPTNTALPESSPTSVPTFAVLPTLDLSGAAASPTASDPSALPTISFVNTPVANNTPIAAVTQPVVLPTSASPATAALGDACNNSVFEADITIPDGEVIKPGFNFQKIWKIRNTGSCTWDEGYSLVYIGGSTPDLDPVNFNFVNSGDFVAGGAAVNIAVNLTTPCTPGKYEGHWRMRSDSGYYFGTIISVYVEVKDKC